MGHDKLNNFIVIVFLVDLEGVDDWIETLGVMMTTVLMIDKERRGSTRELVEMEKVEVDRAFDGGIGDLKQVDYGGSVVMVMDTNQQPQLPARASMLDRPPPRSRFVFL